MNKSRVLCTVPFLIANRCYVCQYNKSEKWGPSNEKPEMRLTKNKRLVDSLKEVV